MRSDSAAPKPKVAAAGAAGTAATVLVALAPQFGIDLSPEAAAGIVTIASFAAGYLKRERS